MIKENILKVRQFIEGACREIGRDPAQVDIVCVTKGRSIQEIKEACLSGLRSIGENRIQEALLKYNVLKSGLEGSTAVTWHMIGHLQSNKVKEAVRLFDLIHSVDSLGLAKEIDKQAGKIRKIQDVLLEVKTSPEETKFGFNAREIPAIKKELAGFANIKVRGLMTIAPQGAQAFMARPYFAVLKKLREDLEPAWLLSMGMSDDFQAAILEGADMIRLGRVIFEG